jgi:hypothetical protein
MKKLLIILFIVSFGKYPEAQELYPYTEPASNLPAQSMSTRMAAMFGKGVHGNRILQRYTPTLTVGITNKWQIAGSLTLGDMHEPYFYFESAKIYAKYRFLSLDEVHKHFRMAAFTTAAFSRNHLDHNELNLSGDQTGVQMGIIATQLLNKLALSGSVSLLEVLDKERWEKVNPQQYAFESINYSLSAGYLIFPKTYRSYRQTNLNLYAELLGGRYMNWKNETYYTDLATSAQFIFNSAGKLNIGYRFQLHSDIYRLMKKNWMISYEYLFLQALKKKK